MSISNVYQASAAALAPELNHSSDAVVSMAQSAPVVDRAPTTSPELGELFAALSAVQGELADPAATGLNETIGNRHLTLSGVLGCARPVLAKHGLCMVQLVLGTHLRTVLGHKSGQFISCDVPLLMGRPELLPMQAMASAVSFARRIAATAMLGIAQADDDGQATAGAQFVPRPSLAVVAPIAAVAATQAAQPATRRGFSVAATIDAINAKATPAELDEARKRVEAAFTGDDLKSALEAIEARLQVISSNVS